MNRTLVRFFRVAGASILSAAITALIGVTTSFDSTSTEGIAMLQFITAALVAFDKYARDSGWYLSGSG